VRTQKPQDWSWNGMLVLILASCLSRRFRRATIKSCEGGVVALNPGA
jgi:hypothetical protein